jgi:hypothetical protein
MEHKVKITDVKVVGLQTVVEFEIHKPPAKDLGDTVVIETVRRSFNNTLTEQQILALIRSDAEEMVAASTVSAPDMEKYVGTFIEFSKMPTIAEVL